MENLETRNQTRVKRYRTNHRRIDYVPGPDALAIIEKHLLDNPNGYSLAGVIDDLVMAGDRAISGNEHATNRS